MNILNASEVGPGQYNVIESGHQQEKALKSRFGQINHETSNFKSQSQRSYIDINRSIHIFYVELYEEADKLGKYDVTYNDIAKKQERKQYYI